MSHFGRSGPPDIRDTYSLLVLNISFRTSADDLFPLFDRYGKVVDVFIPRDRRSGDSRGFAFIRYKHSHEAQKAIERLDGRNVDGRNISVQFAKYGREMEMIKKGRITRENFNWKRSRSRSPRRSRRDDRDYHHGSRRSDWGDQDRHPRHERSSSRRHRSRSYSPSRSSSSDHMKKDDRSRQHRSRSYSPSRSCSSDHMKKDDQSRRHRSRSYSPSRSCSSDHMKGDVRSREDDRRHPRQRTPDQRASPQSSRDSSPRKVSMSSTPDRHLPRSSVSPAKRRSQSPAMQNGAGRSRSRTPNSHSRSASLNSDAEEDR